MHHLALCWDQCSLGDFIVKGFGFTSLTVLPREAWFYLLLLLLYNCGISEDFETLQLATHRAGST